MTELRLDLKSLGVRIGHTTDREGGSGCSVFLFDRPVRASVSVRGAAPASRETDLLMPGKLIREIHGIVLSGGSAFGLESAYGVMKYLEERGIGYDTGTAVVPIVPAAAIYDLKYGKDVRPGKDWGYKAAQNADYILESGIVGASAGATVGKFLGIERASKTGLGIYEVQFDGYRLVAVMVVNALGEVVDERGEIIAGVRSDRGFLPAMELVKGLDFEKIRRGENTTLGVVVTDFPLNKEMLFRLAEVSHNGIVRAVRPSHTPFDGDIIFAVSTAEGAGEENPYRLLKLFAFAEYAVQKAILNSVV